MEIKDIDNSTPLHDFPDIYASNNKELRDTIGELQKQLKEAETQHNVDISNLQTMYKAAIDNLKKEFDTKMTEFEKKFVDVASFEDSVKQIINK